TFSARSGPEAGQKRARSGPEAGLPAVARRAKAGFVGGKLSPAPKLGPDMNPVQNAAPWQGVDCEVRSDKLTRQLYATDASIHQLEPAAVAFPRGPAQAQAVILAA